MSYETERALEAALEAHIESEIHENAIRDITDLWSQLDWSDEVIAQTLGRLLTAAPNTPIFILSIFKCLVDRQIIASSISVPDILDDDGNVLLEELKVSITETFAEGTEVSLLGENGILVELRIASDEPNHHREQDGG